MIKLIKIIKLKDSELTITDCGKCPFFEYDIYGGTVHGCKLSICALPRINGIDKNCPLMDKEYPKTFSGCEHDGTKFKGCPIWQQ
jgi:hypothetical protein